MMSLSETPTYGASYIIKRNLSIIIYKCEQILTRKSILVFLIILTLRDLFKVKTLGDMVDLGLVLTAKHKIHVIWLGMFNPIIRVSHPETVKSILSTALPKGGMVAGGGGSYRNFLPWLGEIT